MEKDLVSSANNENQYCGLEPTEQNTTTHAYIALRATETDNKRAGRNTMGWGVNNNPKYKGLVF